MAVHEVFLPETVVPGHRLGRHVKHDPQSLRYTLPAASVVASVSWPRIAPIFDQGNLGSCTGNAAAGALGSDPFHETLPHLVEDETLAVSIYSDAEKVDGGAGYPPEDDGSSGLSVATVCKTRGYISGYLHAASVDAAHTALQAGPFLVGSYWYASMDTPTTEGIVKVVGNDIRGGHEYLCREYDATRDLWWMDNSWSTDWGKAGRFAYDTPTFARLLAAEGDVTSFVPATQPAPTPTPPNPDVSQADRDLAAAIPVRWLTSRHVGDNAKVQAALTAWKQATGL
jgi:hypothetical protein